jgi:hypothetical protein
MNFTEGNGMKKMILLVVLFIAFSFTAGNLFSANGDLIVNNKVGIGTTSPEAKLHVNNGTMYVDGNYSGGNMVVFRNTDTTQFSGGHTWEIYPYGGSSGHLGFLRNRGTPYDLFCCYEEVNERGNWYGVPGIPWNTPYLTTDWFMGLFSKNMMEEQKLYCRFVKEGIDTKSPWEAFQGQLLLGEEEFIDRYRGLLHDKKQTKEIPRTQRYLNRPQLSALFLKEYKKVKRNKRIYAAHVKHG